MTISLISIKEDFNKIFGNDILSKNEFKQYVFFYKYFPYTVFDDNEVIKEILNRHLNPSRYIKKTMLYERLYEYFFGILNIGFGRYCERLMGNGTSYQYHIKNKSNHARYDYHEIDKLVKQFKL